MKMKLLVILLSVFTFGQVIGQNMVEIPAKDVLELEYDTYAKNKITLKNKSSKGIDVRVLDKKTGEELRGFGLGNKGSKADILVENSSKLVLQNKSNKVVQLEIKSAKDKRKLVAKKEAIYINFTLQNKTAKSIPLVIPTVMNPNLSPFSKSGVSLKIGQKVIFKQGGKRHILFVVDETIKENDVIDVAKLLRNRKKELGLK